jgi:chemotaxis response regulator CheB
MPRCVVGSAGVLDAFQQFITHIPVEVDATYVIMQHMVPLQKSFLPELLGRESNLPIP